LDSNRSKKIAAGMSIASNSILMVGKLVIGILINSISVISEAVHSGIDLAAALVAFIAVREAGKPPDQQHPFGHGKAESISGFFEGLLIFLAIVIIVYEAIHKIIRGTEVGELTLGLWIMGISAALNAIVSRRLFQVSRKTESLALEADAVHLSTDVLTSIGVFLGLLLIKLTGFHLLDPIIALCVAVVIGHAAYNIVRRSFHDLMDERLSEKELSTIEKVLNEHSGFFIGYHDLRSRKVGNVRELDLHLVQSRDISLAEAHKVSDHIEEEIARVIPNAHITIHIEPFETDCEISMEKCRREQGNLLRHIFRHERSAKKERGEDRTDPQ
jgi:cation diffusion facilitator family transporter